MSTDYRYAWRNAPRWFGWYARRRRFLAGFRTLWGALVHGYIGETCQVCGRSYILWHADNDLYGAVTGRHAIPWADGSGNEELAGGLFCPDCFDRMAEQAGIWLRWRPERFR